MDSTISVSKGCFLFKNGFDKNKKTKKKIISTSLFDQQYDSELWHETFKSIWSDIENNINNLNASMYDKILCDIVKYVKDCYNDYSSVYYDEIIPCATLLTGINQPDHIGQFTALKEQLMSKVTPHVAVVYSQDAGNLKQMVENMVLQFVSCDFNESDSEDAIESPKKSGKDFKIKKSHCNMTTLSSWYNETYHSINKANKSSPIKKMKADDAGSQLVVIIPDFESFSSDVLQNFITILSGYTPRLPFVLIFGVATAVSALHRSFPYDVSSKLYVQVFQSHTSTVYLNQVLENIFLSEKCPFHLSGRAFRLLMELFLFYDFSVIGFIQNLKYCMMEHYYGSKIHSLCCPRDSIHEAIKALSSKDLESVRYLPSFRPFVESRTASERISLLTNDEYFTIELGKALENIHDYLKHFHIALRLLVALIGHLPDRSFGKQIRELYITCTTSDVTEETAYKDCMTLLHFQSKEEILQVLTRCICILSDLHIGKPQPSTPRKRLSLMKKCSDVENKSKLPMLAVKEKLVQFKEEIFVSSLERNVIPEDVQHNETNEKLNRKNLKEVLMKSATKEKKAESAFEILRNKFLNYFTDSIIKVFLRPPHTQPFHELYFFNDVLKVRRHIVGSPRASIHTALNNPVSYLQCSCCNLPNTEAIVPTLPDLSIAYKLHLECGKLINLYDWLQAFLTIVDPIDPDENDDEERREIDPEIQARFTRAVSELQFLGFIKTSKRKTDHVSRLTW